MWKYVPFFSRTTTLLSSIVVSALDHAPAIDCAGNDAPYAAR